MPAGKRPQSNTTLYTMFVFVFLFIVATVLAVVFYIQFEKQKDAAAEAQKDLEVFLTSSEKRQGVQKIIGTIEPRQSALGAMVDFLDGTVKLILGAPLDDTTAAIKYENALKKAEQLVNELAASNPDFANVDPNQTGLIRIAEKLQMQIDNLNNYNTNLKDELDEQQRKFEESNQVHFEKEQKLIAEKEDYFQQLRSIEQDYNELKELVEKTSEERVSQLLSSLENEREEMQKLQRELSKKQAQFKMAMDKLEKTKSDLIKIFPDPNSELIAFDPDGIILIVDNQSDIVHLDLGRKDHVYPGLTFGVYEKSLPIPPDGKGKAEVEVFKIDNNISQARIVKKDIRNPIVEGDKIANLIWDSDKKNKFIIAGDFDLNNDNEIDPDAEYHIETLIRKWGGTVEQDVNINTDFIVLGTQPKMLKKPTFEEMELYPTAMDQYEASVERFNKYRKIRDTANMLSIPIFSYDRFLHLIGYTKLSEKQGSF